MPGMRTDLDEESRQLRERIIRSVPAGTFALDRLMSLCSVQASEETRSASVLVGLEPVMLINPAFVARHCRHDEHLALLVLHELDHIFLGHTRLYDRANLMDNIAFDALINAGLCRALPYDLYLDFFRSLNSDTTLVGRLLRPHDGWPAAKVPTDVGSPQEIAVRRRLYDHREVTATQAEIVALLRSETTCVAEPGLVLLGDHGEADGSGRGDGRAGEDPLTAGLVQQTVSAWPASAPRLPGIGRGLDTLGRTQATIQPSQAAVSGVADLLRRAGVGATRRTRRYERRRDERPLTIATPLPEMRDRRVHAREALGLPEQLLFTSETLASRTMWAQARRDPPHVYMDISGSMGPAVGWLVRALDPLRRAGACRVFVFSTVVDEVHGPSLAGATVRNTGGTSIDCVLAHVFSQPPTLAPKRMVILTDGIVGPASRRHLREIAVRRTELYVGLTPNAVWQSSGLTPEYITRLSLGR